jgi:O-antigen/teichoic acid export membrane protein
LNAENIRSSLRFGVPLLPHSLAAVVMLSTDRLVLASTGGPAQVGVYYLGYQIASLLLLLGTALNQAWFPWLYARLAKNGAAEQREIRRALLGIGAFLVVAALGIALLAPLLVSVAGGAHFDQSIGPLRLLAPAMACQAWYLFVSGFLFYHGRTGLLSIITCSVAALQVGLMVMLSRYGILGVASAVLITGLAYASATTFAGIRIHPLNKPSPTAGDEPAA